MDGDESRIEGRHAVVDALLRERLGGAAAPDCVKAVLARHAAGEGVATARRLAAAERGEVAAAADGARWARWLVAALCVLGVGVVVAVGALRARGGAAVAGPQEPVQEPSPAPAIEVRDLAQLKELLAQVAGLEVELRQLVLREPDLTPLPAPYRTSPEVARLVAEQLLRDVRAEGPLTGESMLQLRFLLPRGRTVAIAVSVDDRLEQAKRVLCSVHGMAGSISVGKIDQGLDERDEKQIEAAWAEAHLALAVRNGVIGSLDPTGIEPFLACESVALVPHVLFPGLGGIRTRDLANLTLLKRLRRLDVSRIPRQIDLWAIDHIARLAGLEELVLDRCSIDDLDLEPLGRLPKLKALSLRDCAAVDGSFLLPGVVGHEQEEVPFARLERLDLSGHAAHPRVLRELAARTALRDLGLERCELDDGDLAILAAAKSSLARLRLGGSPAVAEAGRGLFAGREVVEVVWR